MSLRRSVRWAIASIAIPSIAACGVVSGPPAALPDEWAPSEAPSAIPSVEAASEFGFTPGEETAYRIRNIGCRYYSFGSGFAIDDHHIITNAHVVKDHYRLEVTGHDGADYTVKAAKIARNGDLAIITTNEELPVVASLADADPNPGAHITVVGYPLGEQMTTTEGSITGVADDTLDNAEFVFGTTAQVEHGSSGSAAYDAQWEVIGVIYALDSDIDVGYFIPVSILTAFLTDPDLQTVNDRACTA